MTTTDREGGRRPRTRRRPLIWLGALLALAAAGAFWFRWQCWGVQTTHTVAELSGLPAGFDGCRIAHLSDLHGHEYGEDSRELVERVAREDPDLIVITGDLIDQKSQLDMVPALARGLSAVAPTYYVTGNHEWALGSKTVKELKALLGESGVTVLSNRWEEVERNGDRLALAGVDDPNGYADQKTPEALAEEIRSVFGDPFWLLLAHRNNYFERTYSRLGADLVITGHGHGGLIRLPFTDGLVSVERTFFPSYTAGFYSANGGELFVSRGLGNSGRTFRLFNRPEVVVLTLERG